MTFSLHFVHLKHDHAVSLHSILTHIHITELVIQEIFSKNKIISCHDIFITESISLHGMLNTVNIHTCTRNTIARTNVKANKTQTIINSKPFRKHEHTSFGLQHTTISNPSNAGANKSQQIKNKFAKTSNTSTSIGPSTSTTRSVANPKLDQQPTRRLGEPHHHRIYRTFDSSYVQPAHNLRPGYH